jgi:hypothetical protein
MPLDSSEQCLVRLEKTIFLKEQTQVKKFTQETRIYVEHEDRKPLFATDSKIIFGEKFPT